MVPAQIPVFLSQKPSTVYGQVCVVALRLAWLVDHVFHAYICSSMRLSSQWQACVDSSLVLAYSRTTAPAIAHRRTGAELLAYLRVVGAIPGPSELDRSGLGCQIPTLRMQLQPVFHSSSLNALDPGSGREIPAICHDPGAWHGHVTPES